MRLSRDIRGIGEVNDRAGETIDGALAMIAVSHAKSAPLGEMEMETAKAFNTAACTGYLTAADALDEDLSWAPGHAEGDEDDIRGALFARAHCYALDDVFSNLNGQSGAVDEWLMAIRPRIPPSRALDALGEEAALGLVGGALACGFTLAIAEFEVFGTPLEGRATADYLVGPSPVEPHHHRFDYIARTTELVPIGRGYIPSSPCLVDNCGHWGLWPEASEHEHSVDLRQTVALTLEDGRPLYRCDVPGCPLFAGPDE